MESLKGMDNIVFNLLIITETMTMMEGMKMELQALFEMMMMNI
jgi:hypothetical protein